MKLKNVAKFIFIVAGFLMVVMGLPRLILNTWLPYTDYVFYAALFLFFVAVLLSYKKIIEVFSMRTTKYGLNMGTLIFLALILYISANFVSFRYDKSVDITKNKLNSLSLQSLEVIDRIQEPLVFKVFFQGDSHKNEVIGLKLLLKKYERESSKVSHNFIDAYKDLSSGKYLNREDKGKLVMYVSQGEREEKVKEPFSEETITSALYRLESRESKKVYFITGHGERSLKSNPDGTSLSLFKQSLEEKGFEVESLLLSNGLPHDASMIALVGPKKELLKEEVALLKHYIKEGGRLFVALDPLQEVNLEELTSLMGLKFDKRFLLSTQAIAGADALSVLGQGYERHGITEDFNKNSFCLFYEASSVSKLESNFKISPLMVSPKNTVSVKNLSQYKEEVKGQEPVSANIAFIAEGHFGEDAHVGHNHGEEEIGASALALVGDSDFLSDIYISTTFNGDFAVNLVAYLTGKNDLVSIHPRIAQNTRMVLTTADSAFILLFAFFIPLLLLIAALMLWFRRRSA